MISGDIFIFSDIIRLFRPKNLKALFKRLSFILLTSKSHGTSKQKLIFITRCIYKNSRHDRIWSKRNKQLKVKTINKLSSYHHQLLVGSVKQMFFILSNRVSLKSSITNLLFEDWVLRPYSCSIWDRAAAKPNSWESG